MSTSEVSTLNGDHQRQQRLTDAKGCTKWLKLVHKSHFSVLSQLGIRDSNIYPPQKQNWKQPGCIAELLLRSYSANNDRQRQMTAQMILTHKERYIHLIASISVTFSQIQSIEKRVGVISTNLSGCHHRSQMCLESTPSICEWVSMMYHWQFFIYWSQIK